MRCKDLALALVARACRNDISSFDEKRNGLKENLAPGDPGAFARINLMETLFLNLFENDIRKI